MKWIETCSGDLIKIIKFSRLITSENCKKMEVVNPVEYFIEQLYELLLDYSAAGETARETTDSNGEKNVKTIIKMHNEKLQKLGDFSFPLSRKIWQNFLTNTRGVKLKVNTFEMFAKLKNEPVQTSSREFLEITANWHFPVHCLKIQNERCALFLQRSTVIQRLLQQILAEELGEETTKCYGRMRNNSLRHIEMLEPEPATHNDESDLSIYRAKLIRETLSRVLEYSEWTVVQNAQNNDTNLLRLCVQSISAKTNKPFVSDTHVMLKCGIVVEPSTGKLAKISTQEYLDLRANDMHLMALHKYGIRVNNDQRFCELMKRLGSAAVTFDLLEVKHTSPVQIIRSGQGSTKGAAFVLYNSARLETLLRTFDERVQNETYGGLPSYHEVDFTLLKEEEEWQLVFGYIFAFPNLIERCLEQLQQGLCATHLIVRFLSDFVAIFSVYYRRIRILTDKHDHLMPYIYARIYLIKALRHILNKTLALLAIEPVAFM